MERAGLQWDAAQSAIGDPAALKAAQAHATELAVYNLWGVPSIRCGDFVAWGQDRLALFADRLRRLRVEFPASEQLRLLNEQKRNPG